MCGCLGLISLWNSTIQETPSVMSLHVLNIDDARGHADFVAECERTQAQLLNMLSNMCPSVKALKGIKKQAKHYNLCP